MSVAWEPVDPGSCGGAEAPAAPISSDSERAADSARVVAEMEQIGEYIVRRLVGEGGMGRVYEAEERLSKRRVALKVLREELVKSEHARGLFLNEMQILAHLEHPNIVRSLASIEADDKLVTVLEFLEGKTLREVIVDRVTLPWDEAAYVVTCVARALVAAHGQEPPVIHRDLKPENIMVVEGGTVKVMDFGIAKLVQELNQTNTQSVGTLQYMSPEQIDAQTVDQRTDLYCLGLVFYELLAGHPPFQSSSPRTLLNMQCTDAPPALEDDVRAGLPKGIEKLLFELLEKEPDNRPQSAAHLVEQLELFLPDKNFDGLGDVAVVAKSSRTVVSSGSSSRDSSTAGSSKHDTLPSARTTGAGTKKAARDKSDDKRITERKDTVALIDEAAGGRELSTGLSLFIIFVLMFVSGMATYLWRASQTPVAEPDAPAATDAPADVPADVPAGVPAGASALPAGR